MLYNHSLVGAVTDEPVYLLAGAPAGHYAAIGPVRDSLAITGRQGCDVGPEGQCIKAQLTPVITGQFKGGLSAHVNDLVKHALRARCNRLTIALRILQLQFLDITRPVCACLRQE